MADVRKTRCLSVAGRMNSQRRNQRRQTTNIESTVPVITVTNVEFCISLGHLNGVLVFVAYRRNSCDVEGRISLRKLEFRDCLKHDHELELLAMFFLKQGKGQLKEEQDGGQF